MNGSCGESRLEGMHFERNEANPLDADVIIIDEMSMVDISLMHSLLKAVQRRNQADPCGRCEPASERRTGKCPAGYDRSLERFHVVKLTKIFRQAAQSDIIVNAHKINDGERGIP